MRGFCGLIFWFQCKSDVKMRIPSLYSIALDKTVGSFKLVRSGLANPSLLCRLTTLGLWGHRNKIRIKGEYSDDVLDVINKMECVVKDNLISIPPKILREIALRGKIWMLMSHLERALSHAWLFRRSERYEINRIGHRLSQDELTLTLDFQRSLIFLCSEGRCIFKQIPHNLFECLLNFYWTIEGIKNDENTQPRDLECVVFKPIDFKFPHDDGYSNREYCEKLDDLVGVNFVKNSFRVFKRCCPFH